MNPLLRPVLGRGRLPHKGRAALAGERILLLEEGVTASITRRIRYAPRTRFRWQKEIASVAIAITNERVLVWSRRRARVDMPLAPPYLNALDVTVERPDRLRVTCDIAKINARGSGQVSFRFRTARAGQIAALLRSGGPTPPGPASPPRPPGHPPRGPRSAA